MMPLYEFDRSQLRGLKASAFAEGDIIRVSKYIIFVKYGGYDTPALATVIMDRNATRYLDCTPGAGTPYYIDDFKNR